MAPDAELDDRVRQLLDPAVGAVDRMVTTALERGSSPGRRPSAAWRALVPAAAALLLLAFWALRESPSVAPSTADIVLTREGDVVMIQSASGETVILGPRTSAAPERPAGMGFVIAEGEPR